MVSFISILATIGGASFALRKLYEFYWINPNKALLNNLIKLKTFEKRNFFINIQKLTYNYSYSSSESPNNHPKHHLLKETILFKYLKNHNSCKLYTDQILTVWNSKQLNNLLTNGLEPEIKKYLLVNKNTLKNNNLYQMSINLRDSQTLIQIQIDSHELGQVVKYKDIGCEDVMDLNRQFLIFRQQEGIITNQYLILSQDKERPRYRYAPLQTKYNFTSYEQFLEELANGNILEIWETKNDVPIYSVVKSVTISDKVITLSDSMHLKNKKRLKHILQSGQQYFKMTKIDL